MAVDIKSLRIGSHILVNGVRARVEQLSTLRYSEKEAFHLLVRGISPDTGEVGEVGCFVNDEAVEPIPITPELLKELGFKYRTPICIWIKASEDKYLSFEQICGTNRYRVHLYSGDIDRGKCVCRYLNEAEAFLALHDVELIHD